MKYTIDDIQLKTPGVQLREKILKKYGSIKAFADAIDLYESSITQYLSSKTLGSNTFKIRMTRAFGIDFHHLYKSSEDQLKTFVETISLNIDAYNLKSDIEIFERLKKFALEMEQLEYYAVICRCYAYYYFNQGMKDRAIAYMEVAVNTMRAREYVDRFGLYLSDLIYMKSSHMSKPALRKLAEELGQVLHRVEGPETRGHIYYKLGLAHMVMGDLDKAHDYLERVLEYHEVPEWRCLAFLRLGDVNRLRGQEDQSFDYYQRAMYVLDKNSPAIYHVYDELAAYYFKQKNYIEAETYIDRIFQSDGFHVSSSAHSFLKTYARIKIALNKQNEFIDVYERLIHEIRYDFIHTRHQLGQVGALMCQLGWSDETLKSIMKKTLEFCKNTKLQTENESLLKEIIGSVVISLDGSL